MRIFLLVWLVSFSGQAQSSELIYEAQKKEIKLTEKDQKILEVGEISTARYVTGGILGTYPIGFGVGHAIQGRWSQDGAIFTWGELGSFAVALVGALGCIEHADSDNDWSCEGVDSFLLIGGAVTFVGFRLWEIVDVWATPPSHNSKFRNLKNYIETSKARPQTKTSLDLVPVLSPRFGTGLGFKYTF